MGSEKRFRCVDPANPGDIVGLHADGHCVLHHSGPPNHIMFLYVVKERVDDVTIEVVSEGCAVVRSIEPVLARDYVTVCSHRNDGCGLIVRDFASEHIVGEAIDNSVPIETGHSVVLHSVKVNVSAASARNGLRKPFIPGRIRNLAPLFTAVQSYPEDGERRNRFFLRCDVDMKEVVRSVMSTAVSMGFSNAVVQEGVYGNSQLTMLRITAGPLPTLNLSFNAVIYSAVCDIQVASFPLPAIDISILDSKHTAGPAANQFAEAGPSSVTASGMNDAVAMTNSSFVSESMSMSICLASGDPALVRNSVFQQVFVALSLQKLLWTDMLQDGYCVTSKYVSDVFKLYADPHQKRVRFSIPKELADHADDVLDRFSRVLFEFRNQLPESIHNLLPSMEAINERVKMILETADHDLRFQDRPQSDLPLRLILRSDPLKDLEEFCVDIKERTDLFNEGSSTVLAISERAQEAVRQVTVSAFASSISTIVRALMGSAIPYKLRNTFYQHFGAVDAQPLLSFICGCSDTMIPTPGRLVLCDNGYGFMSSVPFSKTNHLCMWKDVQKIVCIDRTALPTIVQLDHVDVSRTHKYQQFDAFTVTASCVASIMEYLWLQALGGDVVTDSDATDASSSPHLADAI
eukprot:ANDGO_04365.mRNA.1 hypothetical protein